MMQHVIGIDIGGTNLVVSAVSRDGSRVGPPTSEATRSEEGADEVLARLGGIVAGVIADLKATDPAAEILGVGVGAPGPLDTRQGIVFLTPNLGWVDLPLRQRVADQLGLPVSLDNDANCAVLGEWWRGAARGARHAIGLTIGTGIGGGVIVDGRLYHGASDCAGEFGHMTIDPEGRRCKCGNYGCLEAYASGPAIAQRTVEAIGSGAASQVIDRAGGNPAAITAQLVYQAANEGDELAQSVVRDTAKYLGVGVANLINIFNPEVVVICGGVTLAGDRLFAPLRQEVARRAFRPAVAACRIVPGELTGTAGVVGAAAAFLQLSADGYVSRPGGRPERRKAGKTGGGQSSGS